MSNPMDMSVDILSNPDLAMPPECMPGSLVMSVYNDMCTSKDRTKPVCNLFNKTCRRCTTHAECKGTGLNKLICSPSGECIDQTDAAALARNNISVVAEKGVCKGAGADGSLASPYCQVSDAITASKLTIFVQPSSTEYTAFDVTNGKSVTVIGPGRDVVPTAVIDGQVKVGGTNSVLTLAELTVRFGVNAILCDGSNVSLSVQRVIAERSNGHGVRADSCAKLTIDASQMRNNDYGGVRIGLNTGNYQITNSLIHRNGNGGGEQFGVVFVSGSPGTFAFNTVALNKQGIQCNSMASLNKSIVVFNPLGSLAGQIVNACATMTDVDVSMDPMFKGGMSPAIDADFKLSAANKANNDLPSQQDHDYFDIIRTSGAMGADIGFSQFNP